MIRIGNFLWGLACNFMLFLFGFLDRYLHRLEADENFGQYDSSCGTKISGEKYEVLKCDGPRDKEKFEMFSGFMFETDEKTLETGSADSFLPQPNTSKYEISFVKDLSGFVEEPKTMSFTVEEMYLETKHDFIGENGNEENRDSLTYWETAFRKNYPEKGKSFLVANDQSIDQISQIGHFGDSNLETRKKTEDSVQECLEESDFGNLKKVIIIETGFPEDMENEYICLGIGQFRYSPTDSEIEFCDYTEKEEVEDFVQVSSKETDLENEDKKVSNENNLLKTKETEKSEFSGDFLFSFMNPGIELCDSIKGVSFISQKVHPISYNEENYFPIDEENAGVYFLKKSDEENNEDFIELDPHLQFPTTKVEEKGNSFEDEEDDEFDILLEHQENIEKMKMEMKSLKMKGLPTILENCESFKTGEDLKPLKLDEKKLEHKDILDEIQRVYKSYSEKMRKLDIFELSDPQCNRVYISCNFKSKSQGFMQLKDPNQRDFSQKSSSAMKSIFPLKQRRIHADPTLKSIFEMHKNLEAVYVGQLCLTWETLCWEYEKAKELLEHDSNGVRSYNLVAGEFQQFQVLVQRFVENEQFLGPRVQNYAKNRCGLRVFLQVPIVKEDCLKEKKENSIEGIYEISILMLLDIIDETIRTFWEFLSADHKDNKFSKLNGLSNHVDLQDPSDSELLVEIKANLHMKEKRLKHICRTGNCIVKKFQKQRDGRTALDLLFAQMDLKLVSRVLNMSRLTTDQLIWCQNKLHKVKFRNRKVHVEPSFLLFPF